MAPVRSALIDNHTSHASVRPTLTACGSGGDLVPRPRKRGLRAASARTS